MFWPVTSLWGYPDRKQAMWLRSAQFALEVDQLVLGFERTIVFSSMWCSSVFTIFSQFPRISPCSPWHCLWYKMLIPQHTRPLPQSTRHFHNLLGSSHSQRCFSHSFTAFHPGSTNLLAGSKPSPISSKAFSIVCRFFHNSHSFPQRMPGFVHRCYTPRLLQWAPRFHPQVLRVMMVHFLTGDKTQDITKSRKVLSH